MKIICTTTFLDGRERFEAGELRVVDDDRAAYFILHGWARDAASQGEMKAVSAIGVAELQIPTSAMSQEARHG